MDSYGQIGGYVLKMQLALEFVHELVGLENFEDLG